LDEIGASLLRLDAMIGRELFREVLKGLDIVERKSAAGRKPFDRVLMFKVLVLQRLYNLADKRLEFQIGYRSCDFRAWSYLAKCWTRVRCGRFASGWWC
jgi:hypothetical protein